MSDDEIPRHEIRNLIDSLHENPLRPLGYRRRMALLKHLERLARDLRDMTAERDRLGKERDLWKAVADGMSVALREAEQAASVEASERRRVVKARDWHKASVEDRDGTIAFLKEDLDREIHFKIEAQQRAERAEKALERYRDAVRIDVTMEGPRFMGANASALKRAWEADRAAIGKTES